MKKILSLLIAAGVACMTACSANDANVNMSNNPSFTQSRTEPSSGTEIVSELSSNNGADDFAYSSGNGGTNILIAYFAEAENSAVDAVTSPSVVTINGETKGRMRALAEMIQTASGGELFSIQTSVKYPGNIGELIDFADGEQSREDRPELISHIENLDQYDVIFVGYPNWWYDMPMVMYSFFDEYDFSEKTIIPFNSHNGSRFSRTISTIKSLEPNSNVIEDGFTVSERDVANAADDITKWVKNLGY